MKSTLLSVENRQSIIAIIINKYINNNYKSYQGKKSGYQGRIYPPGFLNKLYANYNSPNDSVEDYKESNGITSLNDLIENKD